MDESSAQKPHKLNVTERRKHLRLTAMGPVALTVQGEKPQGVYLASIGRGGLGIYLHREIKPNQLVVITLKLLKEGGRGGELKMAARVRWASPVGELYMAGLQFEKMSDQRYDQLLKHLNVMEEMQL
ncbi:MAG: PilZ domain-containing protein [Nitrospirae bacterium]|nr:PilZ domain-containing protein [Nitrospirota bacterium]